MPGHSARPPGVNVTLTPVTQGKYHGITVPAFIIAPIAEATEPMPPRMLNAWTACVINGTSGNSILAMTYPRGQQIATGCALWRKIPGGPSGEGFHEQ